MSDPYAAPLAHPTKKPSNMEVFRLLIWLKWTLLWRAYTRQNIRIIGAVVLVLVFAPFSIGAAVLCYIFGSHNPAYAPILITAVLSAAYVLWLITPLLGFPLNESYDPGRLFVYPVPLTTIFAASVAGSFLELTTLLAMPVFAVMIVIFSTSFAAALVAFLAVVLFLMQTFATAQLIMLSLIGFLRSRRFRDITIVVFPLIAMTFYLAQRAAVQHMIDFNSFDILSWPIWRIAGYFPPGWAAHAATSARDGDIISALLYLGMLAVATAIPIGLAANILKNMYLGDRGPSIGQPAAAREINTQRNGSAGNAALTGGSHSEIAALARKERIYLVREPQYKALGVNTLYTIVVMFFALGARRGGFYQPYTPPMQMGGFDGGMMFAVLRSFILPSVLLLATLPLTFNIFGGDAGAITVLLSFPTPRRKIIIAKNLAYTPVVLGLCIVGVAAGAFLTHSTLLMPITLAWVALAIPVVVGAGNLVSVRFPRKLIVRGQRWSRGGQVSYGSGPAGCGYSLVYLLSYFGSLMILSPVAAAVIGPLLFDKTSLLAVTLPLAAVYSGLVYFGATNMAAVMMERRDPEIAGSLTPMD